MPKPEVLVSWYNASSNDGSSCFDVQFVEGGVQTRNSKRPEVVTDYTPEEWDAFIAGVKAGKFDRPDA
ncbi:DUF397 domain-containing protein [Streptomyces yangpuensis]